MPRYAELHCHSEFSFLDGASSSAELVDRAVQLGLEALALTDHQGLYGAVRFVSAAEAAGIHPLVGVEIELLDTAVPDPHRIVLPARRREPAPVSLGPHDGAPARPRAERPRLPGHRSPLREDLRGVGDAQRGPHLVLLARDQAGYGNLSRLISAANLAGSKGVPQFTHALLERHAGGVIALSGCRHGEIARRLLAGDREGAARTAEWYARRFGPGPSAPPGVRGHRSARGGAGVPGIGGFALELQHHLLPDDDWLVAETVRLAAEFGLPVVVTNDVHYALPGGRELQDVMVAIRHGLTLDQSAYLRRPNGEFYLKSGRELLALPPADAGADPAIRRAWAEGLTTAAELAGACRVDLGFERYRFPGFDVPKGETPFSYLEALCHAGARRQYQPLTPRVAAQLAHELGVIERTGLAEFFLVCWDLMRFARERGIPAQGRGSAGDSIVAYVLGITRVDPIRHNLLFERFINEGRTSYPDVDIDIASSRREEVIRYVYEQYGPEHTGMVCNVITYRARSAVREVGYALGFPRPLVDRVAKALETYDATVVRRDLEADGGFAAFFGPAPPASARDAGATGDTGDTAPSPWERWLELCARLDGRPRHLGIHVGGMLVTAAPLVEIAPLERASMPGRVVVQYDKRDIETLKLIKLDLLGLRMLSAIDDARRAIAADCGVVLDLDRLPEDLPDVFRMIRAADTVGVFQIESRAQMQTLPKSAPRTLDDLVVEVAIIRPGPIQGNAVHPYLRRRQGLEPVSYLHPSLEPILRETLGVILYQEQVMEIAIQVAGFTAAEADGFRRAMGTWRSSLEMEKLHLQFVGGCRSVSGLDEAQAEELFRQVAAFASFGFNKSHAAAFARTAYESAFLKLYYPAQFTAGLINNQPMGFYPVEVLVNDAKRHGVAMLPVDVNRSRFRTTTEWVGMPGEALPEGAGIERRPAVVRSSGCVVPDPRTRRRLAAESAPGYGVRLGLHLVRGIGEEHAERLDGELERGPYRSLADVVARTGLAEEPVERLIRAGALDSLGRPRRELLWQLREVAASTGRMTGRTRGRTATERAEPAQLSPGEWDADGCGMSRPARAFPERFKALSAQASSVPVGPRVGVSAPAEAECTRNSLPMNDLQHSGPAGEIPVPGCMNRRGLPPPGRPDRRGPLPGGSVPADRIPPEPLDLRLPPVEAPDLPAPSELERLADSYAILSLDARRQVVELFRPVLDRLGVVASGRLADMAPGSVCVAGLVVTRQHPMTARGTVFLALEDETGMVNVTLWPDRWDRFRGIVQRHALLWVDGELQREASVVNVVAREVRALPGVVRASGGREVLDGIRAQGYAGRRRA
jgi:error-prone DNA polymerase